jgi:hypothetical protein
MISQRIQDSVQTVSAKWPHTVKDQYFGDVNDFRKYALLIHLSGQGILRTGICWMLTAPDGRADGSALNYLNHPCDFRYLSPDLFDLLHNAVIIDKDRRIEKLEGAMLLRNAVYHSPYLPDDKEGRLEYFRDASLTLQNADWVFFDPDNGIEVPSITLGRKRSSKFLYWHEVGACYQAGKSVLIYQHFPRKARGPYVDGLAAALMDRTGARALFVFITAQVAFLLVPQAQHESHFRFLGREFARHWNGQIRMCEYLLAAAGEA